MRVLWITNVGSHMWHMERPDSDKDLFVAVAEGLQTIFTGNVPKSYKHKKGEELDISTHEILNIIKQLNKGNVNYIWGVHSPIVVRDSRYLQELRAYTRYPGANIYNSIHGLAVQNYRKYIQSGKDTSQKKLATVYRTIQFGINVLEGNGYVFKPVEQELEPKDVEKAIIDLNTAFENTSLPMEPDYKEDLIYWIYTFRMKEAKELWQKHFRSI